MKTHFCKHVDGAFCPDCDFEMNEIANCIRKIRDLQHHKFLPNGKDMTRQPIWAKMKTLCTEIKNIHKELENDTCNRSLTVVDSH